MLMPKFFVKPATLSKIHSLGTHSTITVAIKQAEMSTWRDGGFEQSIHANVLESTQSCDG